MILSTYFPLGTVPMTATGKTDRKVLRRMALVISYLTCMPYQEQLVRRQHKMQNDP